MITRLSFILIFLLLQQSLAAQSLVDTPLITTSLSMNLAGKIDSITEWTLSVKVLEVGAALRVNSDSGNTVITVPDTSFTILEERAWKFDKQGRLSSRILRSTENKQGELKEAEADFLRYKNNRLLNTLSRKDGELVDSSLYIYAGGKISRIEHYDDKRKYNGRKQFFQNKDRVLSTISNKNAALELIDMTKLWYDEKKELKEVTFHDENQRWLKTHKLEFGSDSAGNKHVKIFEFAKPDTCTGMVSYLLNDAGNHLEDVNQDERGMVTSFKTSVFNDYNHCVGQTVFKGEKTEFTSTYQYDKHKNWTYRRIYRNGEPYLHIRRTIIYRN